MLRAFNVLKIEGSNGLGRLRQDEVYNASLRGLRGSAAEGERVLAPFSQKITRK